MIIAKHLVRAWAKYRWGVFDENIGEEKYINYTNGMFFNKSGELERIQ